jgi:hypothetical protein
MTGTELLKLEVPNKKIGFLTIITGNECFLSRLYFSRLSFLRVNEVQDKAY